MSGRPAAGRALRRIPRRRARPLALALAAALGGAGLAGCGETDPTGAQTRSDTLSLWAGLPLRGPWGEQGRAVSDGMQLQLGRAAGRAGPFALRLSVSDTSEGGAPTPDAAAGAVGTALRDRVAIGFVSGPDPRSVRTAVPLTQQIGLTSVVTTGAALGDPETLTPTRRRSWMQQGSDDDRLAEAVGARLRAAGCARPLVVGGTGATPLAELVAEAAPGGGPTVLRGAALGDPATARSVREGVTSGDDCLVVAGEAASGDPAGILERLEGTSPRTVVLTRGVATTTASAVARRTGLPVEAVVDGPGLDVPAVAELAARYRATFGRPMPPGVVSGARAAETVRRAIVRAGAAGNRRDRVPIALAEIAVPGPLREARPGAGLAVPGTGLARATPIAQGWRLRETLR